MAQISCNVIFTIFLCTNFNDSFELHELFLIMQTLLDS